MLSDKYIAAHLAAGWTEVVPSLSSKHRTFAPQTPGGDLHFIGVSGGFREGRNISSSTGCTQGYIDDFVARHLPAGWTAPVQETVAEILARVEAANLEWFTDPAEVMPWIVRTLEAAQRGSYRDQQTVKEWDPSGRLLKFYRRGV